MGEAAHCAIIGAGATGVELAAELHKTTRDLGAYTLDNTDIDKLINRFDEAAPRSLLALPEHLAKSTEEFLRKLGTGIHTTTRVVAVHAGKVEIETGDTIPAELIVWAAGIKAPDFAISAHKRRSMSASSMSVAISEATDEQNRILRKFAEEGRRSALSFWLGRMLH